MISAGSRIRGRLVPSSLLLVATLAGGISLVWGEALRFDCGTETSPVMAGYQRLTAEDAYTKARGYGWEGAKPESVEFKNPGPPERAHWVPSDKVFEENLTDLNRDAVVSKDDLVFRADVPNGSYRISLLIGDMAQAIGSIEVNINGKLVADQVAAFTLGGYRGPFRTPLGWWTKVRKSVEVTDGSIQILLRKNQTYYDGQMAEQSTWENPYRKHWWYMAPEKDPPYFYIGWPFVHNSLMAIEILPDVLPPIVGGEDRLSPTQRIDSPSLDEAISAFNRGDFAASLMALGGVSEPAARISKAVVQLWLAGRPEVEKEKALVPEGLAVLRPHVQAHPEENRLAELVEDGEIFLKALDVHLTRGELGKNHFRENDKAMGWWWLIGEDSPLYYKSQLYIARAGHMLNPYIPTLGTEGEILKRLEKKFPDNRFVKYLLHWEWEPHGDGTDKDDWYVVDYAPLVKDAPQWVQVLYPAWAGILDWSDWFIRWKQTPIGTIGGGLSDDVEIVGAFGYMGYTSRGVSELTIQGARNLSEGNWKYGEINDEIGFYMPFADAEHTAEPTGDTLGMMVQIDYGNPLWIERSMKTGKLIRDLWTDYDKTKHRRFRSNYFNANRVGTGDQADDAWINYRAVRVAGAVVWYNQNPALSELLVELADSWRAAAMSADRGKPRGVIPASISFPDGIIGGTNSPNWYTASHPPGTTNYDWALQQYKEYVQAYLIKAYQITRDAKYLEPLRMEYALAAKYGKAPQELKAMRLQGIESGVDEASLRVTRKWLSPAEVQALLDRNEAERAMLQGRKPVAKEEPAEPGTEKWVAQNLQEVGAWLRVKQAMEGRKGKLQNDITKEEMIRLAGFSGDMLKFRWPLMTAEASATDRTAYVGVINPFMIYTGGRIGGPLLEAAVTYENTTRQFAAVVLGSDPKGFRLLYFSLAPEAREIGVVPWDLELAAKYRLRYGPDVNEDEVMDSVLEEREFDFPQRGAPIRVSVEPRQTYLVEVDQVVKGKAPGLAPDPGLSEGDIRYEAKYHTLIARIHNVGSKPVRNVEVGVYDGDPKAGGTLVGTSVIPRIGAPDDLDAKAVTIGLDWTPSREMHEIFVIVDPNDEVKGEITTFNNQAHRKLSQREEPETPSVPAVPLSVGRSGR